MLPLALQLAPRREICLSNKDAIVSQARFPEFIHGSFLKIAQQVILIIVLRNFQLSGFRQRHWDIVDQGEELTNLDSLLDMVLIILDCVGTELVASDLKLLMDVEKA